MCVVAQIQYIILNMLEYHISHYYCEHERVALVILFESRRGKLETQIEAYFFGEIKNSRAIQNCWKMPAD